VIKKQFAVPTNALLALSMLRQELLDVQFGMQLGRSNGELRERTRRNVEAP
jgi:hypothetical protein